MSSDDKPKRSDLALRELAHDINAGKVFGTWICPADQDQFNDVCVKVFIPMALGDPNLPEDTAHLYEYLDKAGPLSINGFPTFFSFSILSESEAAKIDEHLAVLRKDREAFLSEGSD